MVHVFHLGLGQGGLVLSAPQHGFQPFVHPALLHEFAELPNDGRLVGFVHREVGTFPITQHAQPLKFVPLDVPEFVRVLAALPAQFRGAHVPFLLAELLRDLMFDGQPVAIPARHVGRPHAFHSAGLDDDILENFIERVADVNMAIGVRRTVMQDIQRLARP